jgi:hypothetical protein
MYNYYGDIMRVKLFDEAHEKDLEAAINEFLTDDIDVIDIKYQVAISVFSEEQIYCFSAMIIYN